MNTTIKSMHGHTQTADWIDKIYAITFAIVLLLSACIMVCELCVLWFFGHRCLCSQLLFKRDYTIKLYSIRCMCAVCMWFEVRMNKRSYQQNQQQQSSGWEGKKIVLTFFNTTQTCEPMKWGVNVSHKMIQIRTHTLFVPWDLLS